MKIVVVGLGYVGVSNAVILAQHNQVIGVDLNTERVTALKQKKSPIVDPELSKFLRDTDLDLCATENLLEALPDADYVVVCTPTNYDEDKNYFDTSSVEAVVRLVVEHSPSATVVIKSTIPIGFVDKMRKLHKSSKIMFSPEFLREGQALTDNLNPSRIIIGDNSEEARIFTNLLTSAASKTDIPVYFFGTKEAEAVKLFANSYLAMRIAFFNELDSYALSENLRTRQIIEGVASDPRVGMFYNNPSFGYGGYCLPKDTKQLLSNFAQTPQNMISAIISANDTRKNFLADRIISQGPSVVGIYRLIMKTGSDNFRQSSIRSVMERLRENNVEVVIYEPQLTAGSLDGVRVIGNLDHFKSISELILANRLSDELDDVSSKVFTRDLFGSD